MPGRYDAAGPEAGFQPGSRGRVLRNLLMRDFERGPLDFGGIRGGKKRQYISAVQAALSRDYAPMIEVFRGVIGTTLKSVARTSF
jgi:hypothetical protein